MRAAYLTIAAVVALTAVVPAAAAQAPERIPRNIGMQGYGDFRVSNRLVPATVPSMRFRVLVKASATRWGMKSRGQTKRLAGVRDGLDVVGFRRGLPQGTLAVQQDYIMRMYRRSRRTRRAVYVGERIVERDIAIDPRLPWQPGPAKPGADQYDLETVLIHELGHMAGNKDHVGPCTNSPLWEALDFGEWWRSPSDWYGSLCGSPPPTTAPQPGTPPALRAGAASASRRSAGRLRFGHRRTVVGRVVLGR